MTSNVLTKTLCHLDLKITQLTARTLFKGHLGQGTCHSNNTNLKLTEPTNCQGQISGQI